MTCRLSTPKVSVRVFIFRFEVVGCIPLPEFSPLFFTERLAKFSYTVLDGRVTFRLLAEL